MSVFDQPVDPDRELTIERVFNAPRSRVWEAFMNPEHVAQWWGPKGFTTRVECLEPVAGGKTSYVMMGPDGTEYPVEGVFSEVVPEERFVTTDEFGEDFQAEHRDELPTGVIIIATFEDDGVGTKLTMRIIHPTAEQRKAHEEMGVVPGWQSSFDCLDEFLNSTA